MAALSDYLENKLIDWLLRAQTFTPPTAVYVGLFTTTPTDSTAGTEVTGGAYARSPAITAALTAWAGTQSAGSTTASSGTGGLTSNNAAITWAAAPTANWGTVVGIGIHDASTAGNLLLYATLTTSKTINNGDPAPSFAIAALTFQIDN